MIVKPTEWCRVYIKPKTVNLTAWSKTIVKRWIKDLCEIELCKIINVKKHHHTYKIGGLFFNLFVIVFSPDNREARIVQ